MRNIAQEFLPTPVVAETAKRILNEVRAFQRVPKTGHSCSGLNCLSCFSHHLPKILAAVKRDEPVVFVLPAFPGKSPNPDKVLGALPDQAERLSLAFLGTLCRRIREYYAPGIRILLCSDGRVFSDVVGMAEENVTAYQRELDRLLEELELSDVLTFNLDDVYSSLDFDGMRAELMSRHGRPLDQLQEKIRRGAGPDATPEEQEAHRMYCGITRFLFEDALHPGQTRSRAALQKDARARAYEVIRRSNAWSELIARLFPDAVRLSIHPQTCGSGKLGIRLVADESWMTPWHGVAVDTGAGYVLLKRSEAEALGARLVHGADGRPSHYQLLKAEA